MRDLPIRINLGSGAVLTGVWAGGPDLDSPGADLSGWSIDIFDATPDLDGLISVAWTDASAGAFELSFAVMTSLSDPDALPTFRLRVTPPVGDPETTPEIRVLVT